MPNLCLLRLLCLSFEALVPPLLWPPSFFLTGPSLPLGGFTYLSRRSSALTLATIVRSMWTCACVCPSVDLSLYSFMHHPPTILCDLASLNQSAYALQPIDASPGLVWFISSAGVESNNKHTSVMERLKRPLKNHVGNTFLI